MHCTSLCKVITHAPCQTTLQSSMHLNLDFFIAIIDTEWLLLNYLLWMIIATSKFSPLNHLENYSCSTNWLLAEGDAYSKLCH